MSATREASHQSDAAAAEGARALGRLLRDPHHRPPSRQAGPQHLGSRPGSVVWGILPEHREPALTVSPGTRIIVDTLSHQGMTTGRSPVETFGALGISAGAVLRDASDIYAHVTRDEGAASHLLTGPIWVEGARPGDVLEVRMVRAALRVPYGINRGRPGAGVLDGLLDEPAVRLFVHDPTSQGLRMDGGILIPSDPFPGIIAVAPPSRESGGPRSTKIPGPWGGNLDLRVLTAGSTLYLPVFAAGAQLYLGDPHSAQGDGEVNGTGVEHSVTFTVDLHLHRSLDLRWPVAADATHLFPMAVGDDLDEALARAVEATIELLVGYSRGTLSVADAYALCSVAVDFRIAAAVNVEPVVYASVARNLLDGSGAS